MLGRSGDCGWDARDGRLIRWGFFWGGNRFTLASHIYYLLWLSVFSQSNYANVLDVPVSAPVFFVSPHQFASLAETSRVCWTVLLRASG